MTDTLPPRGWYADPADASRARHWDGARWSQSTRPRAGAADTERPPPLATVAPPVDGPPTRRRRRRQPGRSTGLLTILILSFTLGGMYELAGGSTGRTDVSGAFSSGSTTVVTRAGRGVSAGAPIAAPGAAIAGAAGAAEATAGPAPHGQLAAGVPGVSAAGDPSPAGGDPIVPVLPAECAAQRAARLDVAILSRTYGLPVIAGRPPSEAGPTSPTAAASICSTATFVDQRSHGTDSLTVFTTTAAAAAVTRGSGGGVPIVVGSILVILDPSAAGYAAGYSQALIALRASVPSISSTVGPGTAAGGGSG